MIYDYSVTKANGQTLSLLDYKGKVILVVNTAAGGGSEPRQEREQCGFAGAGAPGDRINFACFKTVI